MTCSGNDGLVHTITRRLGTVARGVQQPDQPERGLASAAVRDWTVIGGDVMRISLVLARHDRQGRPARPAVRVAVGAGDSPGDQGETPATKARTTRAARRPAPGYRFFSVTTAMSQGSTA